ncbi:MAG: hydrogenase formation protein HypD [Tannerellaceae bacterium]|jgi:hydrogenase expression/formation protein HypD|nr:hydrogenase formation protein HypD [Tannerellaceae bacterium]
MKYIDEYRNREQAEALCRAIARVAVRPWRIMEVCGGQTHAIARYRLEEMLPRTVSLLHGPGCPVCVTPEHVIDRAIHLALQPRVTLATFGDMMRVPGSRSDLLRAKAGGADVRILYSPLDAVGLAAGYPEREVVFFAVGFETTLPAHLAALKEALRRRLRNFSLLTSFFTVPPAMEAILSDPQCRVDGFLAAGHVCAVTGNAAYRPLAEKYGTPVVVSGFEPLDLLYGIYRCVCRLEAGEGGVENAYKRAVSEAGNPRALALIREMLEPCGGEWRGLGHIPQSCLRLRETCEAFDAAKRFAFPPPSPTPSGCIAGEIMRGLAQPSQCPCFGTSCRPEHPAGAPMVSSEGVCAAYFRIRPEAATQRPDDAAPALGR